MKSKIYFFRSNKTWPYLKEMGIKLAQKLVFFLQSLAIYKGRSVIDVDLRPKVIRLWNVVVLREK